MQPRLDPWRLPRQAVLGQQVFDLNTDFRDILQIIGYLNDPGLPDFIRWQVALGLFYVQSVPQSLARPAMDYLCRFLEGGTPHAAAPGPRLMDWNHDADAIISDINRLRGGELRSREPVHWWTFLSYFQAIGQGQLSQRVALRQKLRRGERLEGWEKEFYRTQKQALTLPEVETAEQMAEKARLLALLGNQKQEVQP